MEFKEFIVMKRKEKKMTLRAMAKKLNISPAFLSDLENGNRTFPSRSKKYPNLLKDFAKALELNENDINLLSKLADESMLSKDKVSGDLKEYLQKVPLAQQALRKAQQKNISNEKWEEFIKLMEKID